MNFVSFGFFVLVVGLIAVYFSIPKKFQWVALLAASIIFYTYSGAKNILYVVATAFSVFVATNIMQNISDRQKSYLKANKESLTKEQKSEIKKTANKKRKIIMIFCLLFNFGILGVFKYFNFFMSQADRVWKLFSPTGFFTPIDFIIPLGISFYTFQTMGYLIDVFWEKVEAEKNFFKVLLFVSFFPQIIQGPISDYSYLGSQLFSAHSFKYKNYSYGCQRMIWGFYKKLAIADILAPQVEYIFQNYSRMSGMAVIIGGFMYSVQIYADFSGYMDIVCGLCEILDIRLTENFMRPYFSKSITEYWRRWHMSLGEWFKKYIYYPIGVSKWNKNFSKNVQKSFGLKAQNLSATIALIAVWFTTGFWHGASWSYIAWGGINGMFIILSLWLEPVYDKTKTALCIKENNPLWNVFQIIRTFLLVTVIKVLPEVGTLSDGVGFWKHAFSNIGVAFSMAEINVMDFNGKVSVLLGVVLMFAVSVIQTKGPVRDWISKKPALLRWTVYAVLLILTISFGIDPLSPEEGGFMYAGF